MKKDIKKEIKEVKEVKVIDVKTKTIKTPKPKPIKLTKEQQKDADEYMTAKLLLEVFGEKLLIDILQNPSSKSANFMATSSK